MPNTPSAPHTAFIEAALPPWYRAATAQQRKAYAQSARAELKSSAAAKQLLANVQGPVQFCKPLLQAALKRRFGQDYDVDTLQLVRLVRENLYPLPLWRIKDPVRPTLLEAALQNFEPQEAQPGGLEASVVLPAGVPLTVETEGPPGAGDQSPLGVYTHYSYPTYEARPLKPDEFAQMCRELDLGRQYVHHIKAVLQPLEPGLDARDNTQADIAATLLANQRDRLEAVAHVAMMRGHLSSSGYQAVLQITGPQTGALRWEGRSLNSCRLFMMRSYLREGTELHGPLVFLQSGDGPRCIVYLPGDRQRPLYEYPDMAAFGRWLREQLRDASWRQAFCRFVSREDVAPFLSRLENVLSPKPAGQFQTPTPDPNADLELVPLALPGRPVRQLYDRLLALMLKDAQTLVVPTSTADRHAREARILQWVQREMLLLNIAAFFVPGVGEVMAVVGAAQLAEEIFEGIDDWQHGQTDEAMGHVFTVGENLLTLAVIGAGATVLKPSAFIDGLVQIDGPLGKRLWNAELEAYRQPVALPAHLVADELGQYHYANKIYARIEGHFYEQRWDAQLAKWRLRHPRNPNAYEPVLEHNGAGTWRSAGEDPAQWSTERLLKRLGYGAERFSTRQLQQIRLCSGLSDAELRGLDPAREPIPALLTDSLRRFAAARDLGSLSTQIASNGPLARRWAPRLLVRLPRWPADLGLAIDSGGAEVEYGGRPTQDGPRIIVRTQDVNDGKLLDKVLDNLQPTQRDALLGDGVGYQRSVQLEALHTQLREHLHSQREFWFGELYRASASAVDGPARVLQRDFPGLAPEVVQQVHDTARTLDRDRLRQQGKVPLRMAEQARLQLREQRLNRALQGLYLKVDVPLDSDILLMKMAEQLPGWSGQVRVELRQGSSAGNRLAAIGDSSAPQLRYVVRSERGYQAWDDHGNQLSAEVESAAALLRALPDETRVRIGFEVYQGDQLHQALVARAASNRAAAGQALGQPPTPGWLRPPTRSVTGQLGYELSGRGFWRNLFGNAENSRLQALYPELNSDALATVRTELGADVGLGLARREAEYRVLGEMLREWVAGSAQAGYVDGQGQPREVIPLHRQRIADRIAQAWRREAPRQTVSLGRGAGHVLDLIGYQVGELPLLLADFKHVNTLLMDEMALSTDPSTFLRAFSHVELLTLDANPLSQLPEALPELLYLVELRVNHCPLQGTADALHPLRNHPTLEKLHLYQAFAALPAEALRPLATMPRFNHLGLTHVGSGLTEAHVVALSRISGLHTLSLASNGLVMTPRMATAFAGMTRMRNLQLANNPLGTMFDVSGMHRLERLFIGNTQLSEWPPGLSLLMNRSGLAVHHVALDGNPIVSVPDLAGLRFFNNLSQYRTLYSFTISRFDLDVASLEHLERVGVLPLTPASPRDLEVEMPAATVRHLEQLGELPEAELFLQAWRRIVETRDYDLDPIKLRRRAWRLLDALCSPLGDGLPPLALREQVFALGETEMTTCGDGMALILSRWETLVAVERVLHLPAADQLRELLLLSRRLFRVALVDARAAAICGRRISRRNGLNIGTDGRFVLTDDPAVIDAAPALDRLDDIDDSDLAEPLDVVEVRLKLRLMLAEALDLPLQPSNRIYGANVSEQVVANVEAKVRQEANYEQMCGWLVEEPYWRRYLRNDRPDAFVANDEYWAKGFEYLFEISRDSPDMDDVGAVPPGILDTLQQRYPAKGWRREGIPQVVKLNATEQDDLEQWLLAAKLEGEREPYRRLTQPLVRILFP
jgi:hypothetical protein